MNKPKDWWGDPKNAEKWIKQVSRHSKDKSYKEQFNIVNQAIGKKKFKNILEVGAGNGHIIGGLSKKHKGCHSVDINEKLSAYVANKYPEVSVCQGSHNIIKLPFKDNEFDLVFTYQVLQHIHPDDIEQALKELQRITKKEVWMWEGIGRVDYEHGAMTHKAHNGSFVYHIDKMIDCYEVSIPKNKNIELPRQRLYKFKK